MTLIDFENVYMAWPSRSSFQSPTCSTLATSMECWLVNAPITPATSKNRTASPFSLRPASFDVRAGLVGVVTSSDVTSVLRGVVTPSATSDLAGLVAVLGVASCFKGVVKSLETSVVNSLDTS